jgi:hypothetical protein
MTNRRQAVQQFIKAERAEKAYRAKKQAKIARHNYDSTKTHFVEAFSHLKLGILGILSVFKGIPHLISERREEKRRDADAKRRLRNLEQKRKIEEALAQDSTTDGEDRQSSKE